MRICIFSEPGDLCAAYVEQLARRNGIDAICLAEDSLGVDWTFDFDDQNVHEGSIKLKNRSLSFSDLNGAFVRFDPEPELPVGLRLEPVDREFFLSERRAALEYLLDVLPVPVANRPRAVWSNASKPYQMYLLHKFGFKVPKWIVTNQVEDTKRFLTQHSGAVYKSCSGLRSRVRRLTTDVLRKMREGTSPIVIQERIMGKDVRVHVVGPVVFGTEVTSCSIDYRYDPKANFMATSVPVSIRDRCCRMVKQEGLVVGGFDFRVTESEEWFCLELNPAPTFIYYEVITRQPIGKAILNAITTT